MRLLPLAVLAACTPVWHATPAQLAPIAPRPAPATRTIGPLALHGGAPQTSWPAQQAARRLADDHYLDRARIHAEATEFLAFVETFYPPLTPATKLGVDRVRSSMSTLERLDPYSVFSVALAYQQSSEPLNLCILGVDLMWACVRDATPVQARPPFEIGEAAPGIATLTIRDLSNADAPAWRGFADAVRPLASARAVILDLREATGSDPRALLPWVSELTGDVGAPLRAIERPPTADRFVASYAARFTDGGRDPALWRTLLAPLAAGSHRTQPLEVIVGAGCESACELIARLLEAHAGATLLGGVRTSGRLARDEPAMFVLPHSQTQVYFHATRYVLSTAIEAATGPSDAWHALSWDDVDEPVPGSYVAFAVRDLTRRLAGGWPRCDALPERDVASTAIGCEDGRTIVVTSDAPPSAMRRLLATCGGPPVEIGYMMPGRYRLASTTSPQALRHLASSELVQAVRVSCAPVYHLN